jgi:hypothetical protein
LHAGLVSTLKGQQRRLKALTNAWVASQGALRVEACLVPEHVTGDFVEALVLSFDRAVDTNERWLLLALAPVLQKHAAQRAVTERLLLGHTLRDETIRSLTNALHLLKLLEPALSQVASTWAQAIFVQHTDATVQDSVCRVLGSALRLVPRDELEGGTGQVMVSLIHGVSLRLHSSVPLIRSGAMRVAEAFGEAIGQPLVFEKGDAAATNEPSTFSRGAVEGRRARVAAKPKPSKAPPDPDAPLRSDSEPEDGSESDQSGDDYGDDDAAGGGAECAVCRYDLTDDRADLRSVQTPVYLRTCLESEQLPASTCRAYIPPPPSHHLHYRVSHIFSVLSVGEESDAIDKHEAVLASLETLVRSQPADLRLLADPLAHAVLSLENRFNLTVEKPLFLSLPLFVNQIGPS